MGSNRFQLNPAKTNWLWVLGSVKFRNLSPLVLDYISSDQPTAQSESPSGFKTSAQRAALNCMQVVPIPESGGSVFNH